ncbi:unnamed protein product, partial [Mesorhabditis spiculigera]
MEPQKSSSAGDAFSGGRLPPLAMTACLLAFPLVFHYVQTLQAHVQGEVEYRKSGSRDMWKSMGEMGSEGPEDALDALVRVTR